MPTAIKTIKKGRGGARPGAGRKRRDIEDARERSRFQRPDQAETYGNIETPLQYLLRVMADPTADWERRDAAARAAAPYVLAHEVKACNLSVADLTQWKRVYVRFLFRENIIEARCPTCGHEAVQ